MPSPAPDPEPTPPPEAVHSEEARMKRLMAVLAVLRDEGKIVTLRICPRCKSPDLRQLEPYFGLGSAMGITPTTYRCSQCGFHSPLTIEVTNEDLDEDLLHDLSPSDIAYAQKFLKQIRPKPHEK